MSADLAAARAGLYRLLALALDYPRAELLEALRSGEYQDATAACARSLRLEASELPAMVEVDGRELEAAYLATFELAGDGHSACALEEGAHVDFVQDMPSAGRGTGRAALMEDLLRFYHHFGLRLADDPAQRLPPDHLVCQLEMLSHLSLLECQARSLGCGESGYRDAQRDFLRRHVAGWLPRVSAALGRASGCDAPRAFYAGVAALACSGVAAHLDRFS